MSRTPAITPQFGRIVDGEVVEQAVLAHLQEWTVTYLAELERQRGLDARTVAPPRSWEIASEFTKLDNKSLPAVILVSDGLADTPTRRGASEYEAEWAVGVGVVVSGTTQADANRNAKIYAAAVRAAMLQKFGDGGIGAMGVRWVLENYDELRPEQRRSKAGCRAVFAVRVGDVTTANASSSLATPPEDPYDLFGAPPTADTVTIDIERTT